MAANRQHLDSLLGDNSDAPADAAAMQAELAKPQEPAPRDMGLSPHAQVPHPDEQQQGYQQQPLLTLDNQAPQQEQPQQQPQQVQQQAATQEEAMVPSGRLREETERRRQSDERLSQLNARFDLLQEQINKRQQAQLNEINGQQAPDPSEDLEGYVKYQSRQFQDALDQKDEQIKELSGHREQDQLLAAIKQRAQQDGAQFAQTKPDFMQAYHWLRGEQIKEFEAMGASPHEAAAQFDRQELEFTAHRIQQNVNAAEGFYNAAVARGWGAQQQQPQLQAPQAYQEQPQQQILPPVQQYQPQQQQPQGQPSMATMQQMAAQNQTLDQVSGGAMRPMDLDAFANMPDADFAQYADKVAAMMATQMR